MLKKVPGKDRAQSKHSDLIGLDLASTATKVVRLKHSKGMISLSGLDLLPAVDFSAEPEKLPLSRNLSTNYGCLTYTGNRSVVRMINTPVADGSVGLPKEKIQELLNVTDEFRVSAKLIKRNSGRQDSSFLAAAIPDEDVQTLLKLFPSGRPAPVSLEIAGLSYISAFLHARGKECATATVCVMEAGEKVSHFAFLTNGLVTLVGKLPVGAQMLRAKVARDLGLDEEIAESILSDASVNVSSSIASVLAPFLKQMSISKDFIERHQGQRISRIYLSGGLSLLPSWGVEVGKLLNAQVALWSPLENIEYDSASIPADMIKQATRFSAAIGAAIGGLEA